MCIRVDSDLKRQAAVIWKEFGNLLSDEDAACFIKYVDNQPVAFAQCQLRHDYVEGTHSLPVRYLEGIFVTEEYRRRGYAAELLAACAKRGRVYLSLKLNLPSLQVPSVSTMT